MMSLSPMLACALASIALLACNRSDPPAAAAPAVSPPELAMIGANLLEGQGSYRFPVTTQHPQVQRWFDQGMMLAYGFNHDAAERSFLKATELDPDCAMCWWGAALVLGPHVNAAMDPADNADAWQRLQRAVELAPAASAREQAFIQALSARYAQAPRRTGARSTRPMRRRRANWWTAFLRIPMRRSFSPRR